MILLELTEKESNAVKKAVAFHKEAVFNSNLRETEKEVGVPTWTSVLSKLDKAELPKNDKLISHNDLFLIISQAKSEYLSLKADLHISNKKIEEADFVHIALANSLIMWLNGKHLLKQVAKFDYTDAAYQYEPTEE